MMLECEPSSIPAAMPAADNAPTTPAATRTLPVLRFGRDGCGGSGYCSGSHGWYGWSNSVGSDISLLQAATARAVATKEAPETRTNTED